MTIRIVDSEPALVLESDKKNLVISDLHIGFDINFHRIESRIKKIPQLMKLFQMLQRLSKKKIQKP